MLRECWRWALEEVISSQTYCNVPPLVTYPSHWDETALLWRRPSLSAPQNVLFTWMGICCCSIRFILLSFSKPSKYFLSTPLVFSSCFCFWSCYYYEALNRRSGTLLWSVWPGGLLWIFKLNWNFFLTSSTLNSQNRSRIGCENCPFQGRPWKTKALAKEDIKMPGDPLLPRRRVKEKGKQQKRNGQLSLHSSGMLHKLHRLTWRRSPLCDRDCFVFPRSKTIFGERAQHYDVLRTWSTHSCWTLLI